MASDTVEKFWSCILSIGREQGFSRVELRLGTRRYDRKLCDSANGYWVLHIPASRSEYIRLQCHFELATAAPAIHSIVDLLHRALLSKAAEFRTPASNDSDAGCMSLPPGFSVIKTIS